MDVKEAVRTAKAYLADLYEDEHIMHVGLEEVVFKSGPPRWEVTIGFSRSWDLKGPVVAGLADGRHTRSYKVVRINNLRDSVESITDRVLKASE